MNASQTFVVTVTTCTLAVLSGCANVLTVVYDSDPPGALIYEGAKLMGPAPFAAEYAITEEVRKRGRISVVGASAQWASGARVTLATQTIDLSDTPSRWIYYPFPRPASAPGLDLDMKVAREVVQARQAAEAQRQQNAAAGLAGLALLGAAAAGGSRGLGALGQGMQGTDYDWAWDQFRNDYGQLVWGCRGVQTGQFADLSRCSAKPRADYMWPGY